MPPPWDQLPKGIGRNDGNVHSSNASFTRRSEGLVTPDFQDVCGPGAKYAVKCTNVGYAVKPSDPDTTVRLSGTDQGYTRGIDR